MSDSPQPHRITTAQRPELKRLSVTRAAWIVAEREISTQVRTKSFVISLVVIVVLIIGSGAAAAIFGGGGDDSPANTIAVLEDEPALTDQLGETPQLGVETVNSPEAAEQLLRDEEVDAFVTAAPNSPTGLTLTVLDTPPMELIQSLSVTPEVEILEPEEGIDATLRAVVPFVFSLLFFFLLIGTASMTMMNTVEEKQSRIVEILLSTVPARALLFGKVLGNSILAIGQAVLVFTAGLISLMIAGQQGVIDAATTPMLWFLLFFIPGVVFFTALFGASASLVSRQDELGSVQFPAMTLLMSPYFVVIFFANNDLVMSIASYVPFAAPIAMPVRMFFGDAQWFEPILSFGILVLAVALVVALAARIYSRSVLKTGGRVKVSEALRSESAA